MMTKKYRPHKHIKYRTMNAKTCIMCDYSEPFPKRVSSEGRFHKKMKEKYGSDYQLWMTSSERKTMDSYVKKHQKMRRL